MKNKICSFTAFFTTLIIVLSVSCSRTEPKINYGFIKMVVYQEEDGTREQYSFFVLPEDEDGVDNLAELFLYHDREQLRWKIESDEWLRSTHDGMEWIGTRSIASNERSLPRGVFRAVLVNKGGVSSERTFTYDGSVRFPFPEIEISNGMYNINSRWPVNRLVCYDSPGDFVQTITLQSLTGNIAELRLPSSVRTVALWAEDEANFCSAFTLVVPIN